MGLGHPFWRHASGFAMSRVPQNWCRTVKIRGGGRSRGGGRFCGISSPFGPGFGRLLSSAEPTCGTLAHGAALAALEPVAQSPGEAARATALDDASTSPARYARPILAAMIDRSGVDSRPSRRAPAPPRIGPSRMSALGGCELTLSTRCCRSLYRACPPKSGRSLLRSGMRAFDPWRKCGSSILPPKSRHAGFQRWPFRRGRSMGGAASVY